MQRNLSRQRILHYAQAMRQAPSRSEAILWAVLRKSQLGVEFRRQHPVADYITDFYAPAKRLIVEVDGKYHVDRTHHDERRDAYFLSRNIRTLRVTAAEVEQDLTSVVARILRALG